MPELPEVETIARGLAEALVGKTIAGVEVRLAKVAVANGTPFAAALAGERIAGVGRRGKFVVVELASGRALVVHLRMTGRLIVRAQGAEAYPYTNVTIGFTDRTSLVFADVRQFGRMRLVGPGEPWDAEVGVEPLDDAFTDEVLARILAGRRTPVKILLLDQRRIAGIGNIYACEALWEAGIRPSRRAGTLTKPARARLRSAVRSVLARAIALRGTSVDDYVDAEGLRGGFQDVLAVYGRAGSPCPRCGAPIVRTVMAQRGTWWCRGCQR